jgi:putative transposase
MDRYTAKKLTKLKRQEQTCRVYEAKVDRSKLSADALKHFSQLFTETKWFYNYCLGQEDVNNADTTAKEVPVKVGEIFETRIFTTLTAQMKQAVKTRMFNAMSALKALKQNGRRIGRLKFKGRINSIPLKQFNKTFFIDREHSKVGLQGWKPWIRVVGLDQIPAEAEIANATLVRKANDYFFHITTFVGKQERVVPESSVGIDFGCQTQLTFSNGIKAEFQVPVSKRLRRLDRRIMRKDRPDSKKKRQDKEKRQKEYLHLTNKKKDIRHKIVSAITNCFKYVCFQDESIHAWHAGRHGKKIQNSGIGGIISDLKHKSVTPLEVSKFFPSTQLCPSCGSKKKLSLGERTYSCDCGYSLDRDVKSSVCIETEGMKRVPADNRDFKAREILTSTFFDRLSKISCVKVSKLESMN